MDRIWNNVLTNINDFKSGEDFCFLIKRVDIEVLSINDDITAKQTEPRLISSINIKNDNALDLEVNLFDTNIDEFELITQDTLLDMDISESGLIVSINYTNNIRTVPLLPIYFKNKLKTNINYNINGLCS